MNRWCFILAVTMCLEGILGALLPGLPGGDAHAQSLAIPPLPPKYHCVLAGKSNTWITNASPGCYSFEIASNDFAAYAKAKAANPPTPHFFVIYRVLATTWTLLSQNTPFRPQTGTLTEADFYHHRSAGSRTYHASGNSCCQAANYPYFCCNDNSECTANGAPFACCTGAGTGTCTLAADSTCNTPEVVSWDGCTAPDPADCPATSRWDMRHATGSGGPGCYSAGSPYNLRAEGEHQFVNFTSPNVRAMVIADADRLTSGAECSPPCAIQGIRIDEPNIGYSFDGLDFTDVKELQIAASPTDAQHYINDFVGLFAYVKSQRPTFKIFPSMPNFANTREGGWERQIIHAAQGMATEQLGNASFTRICTSYSGNLCNEGSRASQIYLDEWDITLDGISSFARILYGENSPNIEVIIEPFRAGRGVVWLQELCGDAGDACYFGVTAGCGIGCYSPTGVINGIAGQ